VYKEFKLSGRQIAESIMVNQPVFRSFLSALGVLCGSTSLAIHCLYLATTFRVTVTTDEVQLNRKQKKA
jgi:hypothetical protein